MNFFIIFLSALLNSPFIRGADDDGVKFADDCEVCKIVTAELESKLQETGKSHDVLETGYSIENNKNKVRKEYKKSELRLIESLEGLCERILQYNIHKERKDSTRFAKGMSQTFQTLHGLVAKGVKVELGIPYELWNKPSAEVSQLKTQCENFLESYEDDIQKWYFESQGQKTLSHFLCVERALPKDMQKCLHEKGDSSPVVVKQEL